MVSRMKTLFFVIFVTSIGSWSARADILTCAVKSENQASVTIEYGQGVSSIDYSHEVTAQGTTTQPQVDRIFSQLPPIRGGFKVDYCNPNDNSIDDQENSFSLYSLCSGSIIMGRVYFQADFTKRNGGKISFLSAKSVPTHLDIFNCR